MLQRIIIVLAVVVLGVAGGALYQRQFASPDARVAAPEAAPALDARARAPPVAPLDPTTLSLNGIDRQDDYYWLKQKDDPRVRAYLEAENAFALAELAPLTPLVDALYAEMTDRLDDADVGVPFRDGEYWYETRYAEGADYPQIVRRKGAPDGPEEMVLDVPKLAAGHAQYNLNAWAVSPDGRRVAYAVDFSGDRKHRIFIAEIASGTVLDDTITEADSDLVWAADNATLFYVKSDPVTVRSFQAWRHTLGGAGPDALIYQEDDETFSLALAATASRAFLVITSGHTQTSEQRLVPLDRPEAVPQVIAARVKGVRYRADHIGDRFYILTNLDAPDQRVVSAPEATPGPTAWRDVIPETPGSYLRAMVLFEDVIALDVVREADGHLRLVRIKGGEEIPVPRPQAIGAMGFLDFDDAVNREPSAGVIRFGFESLDAPSEIRELDFATGAVRVLKRDPAWAWFDPSGYEVLRLTATAADGAQVPVTVLRRKGAAPAGGQPTLLIGYGAYGSSFTPSFVVTALSLVDRGFAFAIAHVRGGRDKGEAWYASGRMAAKMNTFTDFIAAGEALIAQGLAAPDKLYARGGSAGGLLMGAVVNLRPDLFAGVIAEVPFVDVLTTMSDPTIPLTTFEYEEWGNPAIPEQYGWMRAYSPYDNVTAQAYPPLFVTAGFNDSQVAYFEPAKWVAKLRRLKTDTNPLYFLTEMDAGHAGDSGRLGFVQERARLYAWLLALSGVTE